MELWLASLLELVNLDLTAAVWEWYIYILLDLVLMIFVAQLMFQAMINS